MLVTTERVVSFYAANFQLEWEMALSHVEKVVAGEGGLVFHSKRRQERFEVAKISDEESRELLRRKIEE